MRRILGLTLCYVLALQAIFSAYGIALALTEANDTSLSYIICHSAADQTTDSSGTSKHPAVPCPMCAVACWAVGLAPDSATAIAVAPSNVRHVAYGEIDIEVTSPPGRAGLARAPPQFG